jgi:sugar phosphate isomerase/epimerase
MGICRNIKMIDVCFFADEVSRDDFEEAIKLGVEAGANTVEVRGGVWGKHVTEIDDNDVKRVQDVLNKYNVRVASIGSPFGKCSIDNPEEYERHLQHFDRMVELAHAFDTQIIRGFAFWNPNRKMKESSRPDINDYIELIVEKLSPVVPIAESANVTLSFENEDATLAGTCEETRTVIDALGNSPALTSCWDVNNGLHCGEIPLPDGYSFIKGLVRHVHVKPNREKNLDPIRDTNLTYEQLLKTLIDDGFTGAASIEHWGNPEQMLDGIRQLRAVVDNL